MNGWRIEPDGVVGVLTDTQTAASDLSTAFDGLAAAQASLVTGADADGAVPAAVADLIASHKELLDEIGHHITAGLAGATAAATAYFQGDAEMAATAQANAISAADSGNMDAFDLDGGR